VLFPRVSADLDRSAIKARPISFKEVRHFIHRNNRGGKDELSGH